MKVAELFAQARNPVEAKVVHAEPVEGGGLTVMNSVVAVGGAIVVAALWLAGRHKKAQG